MEGKILLKFINSPKNFIYGRYPLMLCCFESTKKPQKTFSTQNSFFEKINKQFLKESELFTSKTKDEKLLIYYLSQVYLNNRTWLQIMAQNRLY